MTTANLKEQRKFMAEARARRVVNQSTLKSEPSEIQTWVFHKKKSEVVKEAQVARMTWFDLPNSTALPSLSTKKKKLMMIKPISNVDHVVSSMMQEPDQGSQQHRSNPQFKFWDNSFDGLKFLYDHLNSDEDIGKTKSIGP